MNEIKRQLEYQAEKTREWFFSRARQESLPVGEIASSLLADQTVSTMTKSVAFKIKMEILVSQNPATKARAKKTTHKISLFY